MAKKSKLVESASELVRYRPKPTLRIDAKDYPGIKDLKVGQTVTLSVTAKVKSISAGDEYDDYEGADKTTRATLSVSKVTNK